MSGPGARTELKPGYANGRTALTLVADFSNHWKLMEKTFGYKSARIKVPFKDGADFFVHVNLIAQPANTRPEVATPPDVWLEEDDGPFHFEIKYRKLTVVVPLNRGAMGKSEGEDDTTSLYRSVHE